MRARRRTGAGALGPALRGMAAELAVAAALAAIALLVALAATALGR